MRKNIFTKATMRRAAAFGLAGCMAASSLTGCGSSKTESTTAANAETKVEAEGESKAEAADGSDIHVGIKIRIWRRDHPGRNGFFRRI